MSKKSSQYSIQKILAILVILGVPLFIAKEYKSITRSRNQVTFDLGMPTKNEFTNESTKSFVVFIFSDQPNSFSEKNLRSVLDQTYSLFRVVYLDYSQGEEDLARAKEFALKLGKTSQVAFLRGENEEQVFDLYYQEIKKCRDDEVVVHMKSSDWLASDRVLEKLNDVYVDPEVWLTYGEFLEYPTLEKGNSKPLIHQSFRESKATKRPWMQAHLKTYYAGLMKHMMTGPHEIKYKALSKEDPYLMLSLLRLSKWHVRYIPEVIYIHDGQEKRSQFEQIKERFSDEIKKKIKKSDPVVPSLGLASDQSVDMFVFSDNHPRQLSICLNALSRYGFGINHVNVFFQSSSRNEIEFRALQSQFPQIEFFRIDNFDVNTLKPLILDQMHSALAVGDYVVLASDQMIIKEKLSFVDCCQAINEKNLKWFYFGDDIAPKVDSDMETALRDVFSKAHTSEQEVSLCQGMLLAKKHFAKELLTRMDFHNLESLLKQWKLVKVKSENILLFQNPKTFLLQLD